ncbi:RNA polymerase subunit sigma [Micromonospora echinospora]|uniref:RNA polymerase sigma-70 factor, ECF subfamily n=1 Tax=Micromonospora echinospora TaxID=1877 RepID=A0A1C4WIN9_MICEC|nr:sigma-70 family RNA polymerase sigma factor [Micromonospora echinospora]OZV72577.1 RNA polymerase subunit sigma [Micromonospora echinospora]SCE96024.1 RNA polymerase sigma-70 factor, ECF subfamily [Micromonospora echinospora]
MDVAEKQFTELYGRHHGDVWRYVARRVVGSDVGDVVAEVFLVAWRRLSDVPSGSALPWLYGVARLVLANEARGRRRWQELTLRVAAEPDRSVTVDHADEVVSQHDIAVAFSRLPDADQEVLRLVAWERLTAAEAAVVLGQSRATCAMRLMRARRRLRAQLGAAGEGTQRVPRTVPSMSDWGG